MEYMEKVKFSFIIPYYNAEATIGRCLDSLIEQDMSSDEYEIIIVDDGSTHSLDVVKDYMSRHSNIRYFWQNNARQGAARNHGIREARGRYIHFCDADDMVEPNSFGRLCNMAEEENVEILFFNQSVLKEVGALLNHQSWKITESSVQGTSYLKSHPYMPFGPCHYIINRKFINDNKLHFEQIIPGEDGLFMINALLLASSVSHVDVVAYYYIQNDNSTTHKYGRIKHSKEYTEGCLTVIKRLDRILLEVPQAKRCCETIERKRNSYVWSLLQNAARFLPLMDNRSYIKELKVMGRYPFSMSWEFFNLKLKIVHICMCIYPLWISFVACLQLLPKKLKYHLK